MADRRRELMELNRKRAKWLIFDMLLEEEEEELLLLAVLVEHLRDERRPGSGRLPPRVPLASRSGPRATFVSDSQFFSLYRMSREVSGVTVTFYSLLASASLPRLLTFHFFLLLSAALSVEDVCALVSLLASFSLKPVFPFYPRHLKRCCSSCPRTCQ